MPQQTKPSQAQLKKAYEILMAASPRDRKFLFKGFIENLEEQRQKLAKGEDKKFDPLYRISINAADDVSRFVRRLIGYNPTWTTEYLLEYGHYSNATKYSFDDRQLFIWFIHSLVIRGASQTQAIELAKQVLNKKKMYGETGLGRELLDCYKEFKESGEEIAYCPTEHGTWFYFLLRDYPMIEKPSSDVKAFQKALGAYRKMFEDVVNLIKENTPIIQERDSWYPKEYQGAIFIYEEDREDPLDYFYNDPPLDWGKNHLRALAIKEYLNSIPVFWEK